MQAGVHFQFLNIQVGLDEAVEEHNAIRTGFNQAIHQVWQ